MKYFITGATKPDVVLPTVEAIPGHPGRTLAQWAQEHASDVF
jgi:hypothetical protein